MGTSVRREARVGELYEDLRPLMFSIAYRMLGTASEAEDIVQEAFLRFHRETAKGTLVDSPKAYLSAVTTRLSIDHLRSARVRRERYVGTWLPEPLLTDTAPDVAQHAETAGPAAQRNRERLGVAGMRAVSINGQPGALFLDPEGRPVAVVTLDIADDLVQTVRFVSNPDKLRHLGANVGPTKPASLRG